jgi:uncharacterized protein (TIGR02001 family)
VGSSLLLTSTTAFAAEVSGNVSLASDYVYRGISQTEEAGAILAGFDIFDSRAVLGLSKSL